MKVEGFFLRSQKYCIINFTRFISEVDMTKQSSPKKSYRLCNLHLCIMFCKYRMTKSNIHSSCFSSRLDSNSFFLLNVFLSTQITQAHLPSQYSSVLKKSTISLHFHLETRYGHKDKREKQKVQVSSSSKSRLDQKSTKCFKLYSTLESILTNFVQRRSEFFLPRLPRL